MIAYIEVPPAADVYDRELKTTGAIIAERLGGSGRRMQLERNSDLCAVSPGGWTFIRCGIFKCYFGSRLVRLYETGDLPVFAFLPDLPGDLRCTSEFGSEVTIFDAGDIALHIATHPGDAALLIRHVSLQSTLTHILCAAYTTDELRPEFRIREFEPGAVIIAEGAPALEIYQMIQGDATVTVRSVEVGKVGAGELFGEIGFFTGLARSATVTANTACTVQTMNKSDFLALARMKPSVNIAVSKTLSERLVETNRKISQSK